MSNVQTNTDTQKLNLEEIAGSIRKDMDNAGFRAQFSRNGVSVTVMAFSENGKELAYTVVNHGVRGPNPAKSLQGKDKLAALVANIDESLTLYNLAYNPEMSMYRISTT